MELITKQGFKQTDVGLIPEDWGLVNVGALTNTSAGGTPSTKVPSYWGGNIPWMNSGELNLKQVYDVENRITEEGLANSSTKFIPKQSILIGLAGQGKTRGTAALNHIKLCTNQSIAAIYPSKKYDSFFLYYYIDSQYDELRKLSTGDGGRGGLNLSIIKSIQIPLPPTLNEQKAIATALSDVDALITSLEQTITKKKAIKQGATQQLLTPPHKGGKRLPGFSGEWVEKIIGKIGNTFGGLSGKSKRDFEDGKYPYITFLNVMNNTVIDTSIFEYVNLKSGEQQNKARKGDLFFNTSSETPEEVGMCAVLNEDFETLYLNSFCFGFRLKEDYEVDGLFFSYLINSSIGRNLFLSLAQGATRYNLSKSNFNKLIIDIPKTKEEQKAIAQILSDMDAEITQLESKKEKYQAIKQGMMQELLTGKTRLI